MQRLAEEAVRYQCDPTSVIGSGTDPRTAWTFLEIIVAAEAHLRVLGTQMERLSWAGTAITVACDQAPSNRAVPHAWRVGWRRARTVLVSGLSPPLVLVPRWCSGLRCLGIRIFSWMR